MSDEWKARYEEEYQIVARVWTAVKNGTGYRGEELSGIVADYVKRADGAAARQSKLREVFEACRAHLQRRHGCANFDDFNVETLEWPADHDFELTK